MEDQKKIYLTLPMVLDAGSCGCIDSVVVVPDVDDAKAFSTREAAERWLKGESPEVKNHKKWVIVEKTID